MRILILIAAAALLAACDGQNSRAVAACKTEIAGKVEGQDFRLDEADMAASATREGEDTIRIQSSILIDPGQAKEVRQTFDCRVRISDSRADVIALQFIW